MSLERPYDCGNDAWLMDQCKAYPGQMIGTAMTEKEMMRILYLAAEGAVYLCSEEIETLERRIVRCQVMATQAAVRAAKTKN